ncbi:MAG: response regulator [Planctomycetes bacterium]|nr:response regulator [Planctomycetota bacterium]
MGTPTLTPHGQIVTLFVDDHPDETQELRRHLAANGFDCRIERSIAAGIERILDSPDLALVLLDLNWQERGAQDRSGRDLLNWLHLNRPELPVVILTKIGEIQEAMECMTEGAAGYLCKDDGVVRQAEGGDPSLVLRYLGALVNARREDWRAIPPEGFRELAWTARLWFWGPEASADPRPNCGEYRAEGEYILQQLNAQLAAPIRTLLEMERYKRAHRTRMQGRKAQQGAEGAPRARVGEPFVPANPFQDACAALDALAPEPLARIEPFDGQPARADVPEAGLHSIERIVPQPGGSHRVPPVLPRRRDPEVEGARGQQ